MNEKNNNNNLDLELIYNDKPVTIDEYQSDAYFIDKKQEEFYDVDFDTLNKNDVKHHLNRIIDETYDFDEGYVNYHEKNPLMDNYNLSFLFEYLNTDTLKELKNTRIDAKYNKFTTDEPNLILVSLFLYELGYNNYLLLNSLYPLNDVDKTIDELNNFVFNDFNNEDLWTSIEEKFMPSLLLIKNILRWFDDFKVSYDVLSATNNLTSLIKSMTLNNNWQSIFLKDGSIILINLAYQILDKLDAYLKFTTKKFKEVNNFLSIKNMISVNNVILPNLSIDELKQDKIVEGIYETKKAILDHLNTYSKDEIEEAKNLFEEFKTKLKDDKCDLTKDIFYRNFSKFLKEDKQISDKNYDADILKTINTNAFNFKYALDDIERNYSNDRLDFYLDNIKKIILTYLNVFFSTKNALSFYTSELDLWYDNAYKQLTTLLKEEKYEEVANYIQILKEGVSYYQNLVSGPHEEKFNLKDFKPYFDRTIENASYFLDIKNLNDYKIEFNLNEDWKKILNDVNLINRFMASVRSYDKDISTSFEFQRAKENGIVECYAGNNTYKKITLKEYEHSFKLWYSFYSHLINNGLQLDTIIDVFNKEKENIALYNKILEKDKKEINVFKQQWQLKINKDRQTLDDMKVYDKYDNKKDENNETNEAKKKNETELNTTKSKQLSSLITFLKSIYHKDFNRNDALYVYDNDNNVYYNITSFNNDKLYDLIKKELLDHKCNLLRILLDTNVYEINNLNNEILKETNEMIKKDNKKIRR